METEQCTEVVSLCPSGNTRKGQNTMERRLHLPLLRWAGAGALKNEGLLFAHGKREPLLLRMSDYLINCDLRELKC